MAELTPQEFLDICSEAGINSLTIYAGTVYTLSP